MANTIAIMTAVDTQYPDILDCVKIIADRFTRLNDIPVRIITDIDMLDTQLVAPHFARYHAWRFVPPETEHLIYFDYDILPIRKLPALPKSDFAAVVENSKLADYSKNTIPLLNEAKIYFNSGFFVAGRKTEKIFERMLTRQTALVSAALTLDQTLLNVEVQTAVRMNEIVFEELPNRWCMASWDITVQSDPCMVHYIALADSKLKPRAVSIVANKLNQLEQQVGG